uniref:Uncharacterized protein n=1 Tax=Rhizophora mucronata TaxID=61149 RepID=A0A2P2QG85_RHIMU
MLFLLQTANSCRLCREKYQFTFLAMVTYINPLRGYLLSCLSFLNFV